LALKRRKAKNELNTGTAQSIFVGGGSVAGPFVNEQNALSTAAVYACVRVISETVAGLPLHLFREIDDGLEVAKDHKLNRLLHTAPNPEMTSFALRETMLAHLLLWGNSYVQILRDGAGRVAALYPLLPSKMEVSRSEAGEIYYTYWRDFDETRPGEKSGGVTLTREQVLHIPGLSFNGLVGLSPIGLAKEAVGMAMATERYGAGFFANSATPAGILEHPGAIKDTEQVRVAWEALFRGKTGKVAVLEDGMKFHSVSIPPEQAQFLETRKFQLNEIARIFRVPPHMIGDLEKSSFSNIEQQSLEFAKYTIQPWVVRLEQAMAQSLLTEREQDDLCIKFNLDGLLRGDYETRMKGYAIGIQNGFLSPNDCRRLENMNKIPGGDEYVFNGGMVGIGSIKTRREAEEE
jgi:HK97 family phage portal protein